MKSFTAILACSAMLASVFAGTEPEPVDAVDPQFNATCTDETCELEKRELNLIVTLEGHSKAWDEWYCNSKDPKKVCGAAGNKLLSQVCELYCVCHPLSGEITCLPYWGCTSSVMEDTCKCWAQIEKPGGGEGKNLVCGKKPIEPRGVPTKPPPRAAATRTLAV